MAAATFIENIVDGDQPTTTVCLWDRSILRHMPGNISTRTIPITEPRVVCRV